MPEHKQVGEILFVHADKVSCIVEDKVIELEKSLYEGTEVPQTGQNLMLHVSFSGKVLCWNTIEPEDQNQNGNTVKQQSGNQVIPATLIKQRLDYINTRNIRYGKVLSFDSKTQKGVLKSGDYEIRFYFQDKRLPMVFNGRVVWIDDDLNQIRYYPRCEQVLVYEVDYSNDGQTIWAWTLPMFYESAIRSSGM